jgi:hypothetical protein
MSDTRRREFITLIGGAAAWPLADKALGIEVPSMLLAIADEVDRIGSGDGNAAGGVCRHHFEPCALKRRPPGRRGGFEDVGAHYV